MPHWTRLVYELVRTAMLVCVVSVVLFVVLSRCTVSYHPEGSPARTEVVWVKWQELPAETFACYLSVMAPLVVFITVLKVRR